MRIGPVKSRIKIKRRAALVFDSRMKISDGKHPRM
jgi:hypothetical protein